MYKERLVCVCIYNKCVYCEHPTGKAHERTLSGLVPQPFFIMIVNMHKVDSLQAKGFSGDHHFLTSIQ